MPLFDTHIWIVHREPGPRSALARMIGGVGGRHEIVLGGPLDTVFEATATPPHAVVLDVSTAAYDPEPELDFARRLQARAPGCAWILVAEPTSRAAAEQLFDALASRLLAYPPHARSLQAAVREALAGLRPLPLSRRIVRDHVAARFSRWFGDHEPPGFALAADPRLAGEPLLVSGEPGTGRGLLLRHAHQVSEPTTGRLLRVSCAETTRPDQLLAQIEEGAREDGPRAGRGRLGIWLADLDRLSASAQARVLDWMEFEPPLALPAAGGGVRWMASAGPDPAALDPGLALAFAELHVRTTPLRMRPDAIPDFVAAAARAWAATHRETPKSFDAPALELLRGEPWPGNLAELEAVVARTLAHAAPEAATIRIGDLRFDGGSASPEPRDATPGPGGGPPGSATAAAAPEPAPQPAPRPGEDGSLARLAAAVAHEVRNPLVSIRTFSELLEEHHDDAEFRERFGRLVAEDVRRIEEVVDRLEHMGAEPATGSEGARPEVDVTGLLEGLLDAERPRIQAKRLLVLKELDRARPLAFGDAATLRDALGGLLGHAIEEVSDRGDLYLASQHRRQDDGQTRMRIQLRYRIRPVGSRDPSQPSLRDTVLEHVRADSLVRSQGGSLSIDTSHASETLLIIDLPAPSTT